MGRWCTTGHVREKRAVKAACLGKENCSCQLERSSTRARACGPSGAHHERRIGGDYVRGMRIGIHGGRMGTQALPRSGPKCRSVNESHVGRRQHRHGPRPHARRRPSSARGRRTWGPKWPRLPLPEAWEHTATNTARTPAGRGGTRQRLRAHTKRHGDTDAHGCRGSSRQRPTRQGTGTR